MNIPPNTQETDENLLVYMDVSPNGPIARMHSKGEAGLQLALASPQSPACLPKTLLASYNLFPD